MRGVGGILNFLRLLGAIVKSLFFAIEVLSCGLNCSIASRLYGYVTALWHIKITDRTNHLTNLRECLHGVHYSVRRCSDATITRWSGISCLITGISTRQRTARAANAVTEDQLPNALPRALPISATTRSSRATGRYS